jgi:hypothetical protein
MATASKLSYAGYAIDWGDVTSGNAVGTYHIGDGTPATNAILQPTTPAQGSSGSWGPVSHTYATAGTYTVCVIMYDLGEVKPFKTTGYHSLQAGGTGRNTDNSVDNKGQVPSMCQQIDVTQPTSSPFQSFRGITAGPTTTPPPTGTASLPSAPDQGVPMLPLFLLAGSCLASVGRVQDDQGEPLADHHRPSDKRAAARRVQPTRAAALLCRANPPLKAGMAGRGPAARREPRGPTRTIRGSVRGTLPRSSSSTE